MNQISKALHERGFGILLVLFVLPCCIPVPVPPGLPLIFSIPLIFLSLQMILGNETPWLPKWLGRKRIRRTTLAKIIKGASPILRRLEHFLRPRLSFASTRRGERVVGLLIFLFAAVIALPLPLPFSNFIPGVGILLMALGLVGKDGVMILTGIFIGLVGATLVLSALFFGVRTVNRFISRTIGI